LNIYLQRVAGGGIAAMGIMVNGLARVGRKADISAE